MDWKQEKKPLLPTEERLMRSINNKRLKRKKDMREMKHAATLEDSSDVSFSLSIPF